MTIVVIPHIRQLLEGNKITQVNRLFSTLTLIPFLAFAAPLVNARTGGDNTTTTTRAENKKDDSIKISSAGLLGLLGLFGLKRRDKNNSRAAVR